MENLSRYFDAKITVRSKVHYLEMIEGKLAKNQSRISLFRESVFGPWLDIPACHANDNHLLNFVLQHQVYIPKLLDHCPPISFRIGDNVLQFGRWEFLLITGLVFGPLPDLVEVDNSPFGLRLFPEKKFQRKFTVKGTELLAILENDKEFDALSNEDAVRVCLLIVAEVIFNARGPWYVVPNHFLQLVKDFSAWNAYPRGEFLWRRFYVNLANVVPRHYEAYYKKKQELSPTKIATYTLCGFIWAFKIWILKSYPNSRSWWNKDPSKIPRGLSWSKGKTFRKRDYNVLCGSGSNPILKLIPTSEERLQPWFVRSNDYFVEQNLIQSQADVADDAVEANAGADDGEIHADAQEQEVQSAGPEENSKRPNIAAEVEALKAIVYLIDTPGANVNVLNDVKKILAIVEKALNIQHQGASTSIPETSEVRPNVGDHFVSKVANTSSPIHDNLEVQQFVDENLASKDAMTSSPIENEIQNESPIRTHVDAEDGKLFDNNDVI